MTRASRAAGFVLLAALMGAGAVPALAQTAQEKALGFYQQGVEAFRRGDYATARDLFERAYMLDPAPVLLFNLGRANAEMGEAERAIEYYQMYLDRVPDAPDREDVERRIRVMRAIIERRRREAEQAAAGQPATAPATAPAADPASAPAPAEAKAPPRVADRTAPDDPPPSLAPYSYAAFGLGAAALGAGIVFGIQAADAEERHHRATTADDLVETRDEAERSALLANIGYGVAAVGVAAGLTLLLLDGEEGESATVAPAPGGGAVLGWSTRF